MQAPYVLVVVTGAYTIKEFEDIDVLVENLRELIDNETQLPTGARAVIIEGEQLFLTKGSNKHLVLPDGEHVPILAASKELDREGNLIEPVVVEQETEYEAPLEPHDWNEEEDEDDE